MKYIVLSRNMKNRLLIYIMRGGSFFPKLSFGYDKSSIDRTPHIIIIRLGNGMKIKLKTFRCALATTWRGAYIDFKVHKKKQSSSRTKELYRSTAHCQIVKRFDNFTRDVVKTDNQLGVYSRVSTIARCETFIAYLTKNDKQILAYWAHTFILSVDNNISFQRKEKKKQLLSSKKITGLLFSSNNNSVGRRAVNQISATRPVNYYYY